MTRPDWEAIKRDYQTDKFTLRELEAKHGVPNPSIARKLKKDGWVKDLSGAVKIATNVALLQQSANNIVSNQIAKMSETVSIAAEINKQVILKHRSHIGAATEAAVKMLEELTYAGDSKESIIAAFEKLNDTADEKQIADAKKALNYLLSLHSRVGSIHKLADTLTKVQTQERKAFGIADDVDDSDKRKENSAPVINLTMK